jgi:hypothetical protein
MHEHRWLSSDELDQVKLAFQRHVLTYTETARDERDRHERRRTELLTQQQKLVQLFYKNGISEEVMAAEQARIEREQGEVDRWTENAKASTEELDAALDEAVRLMSIPAEAYRRADPTVRRLINQAIFERIEVWLAPDDEEGPEAEESSQVYVWNWDVPSPLRKGVVERFQGATRLSPVYAQITLLGRLIREGYGPSSSQKVRTGSPVAHFRRPPHRVAFVVQEPRFAVVVRP